MRHCANGFLLMMLMLCIHSSVSGQSDRMAKVSNLYSCLKEYEIECPRTVLAIAVYETGWLECKHCTYQYNNLFGFRANHGYLQFENIYECLEYFKTWQLTYYDPWKAKHPRGSYYDYLVHMKYARASMANYVKTIRAIERLTAKTTNAFDQTQVDEPESKQRVNKY